MKNSQIPGLIKKLNRMPGVYAIKLHGSAYGKAGTPDVLCVVNGQAYLFEVKQPGEAPTAIQAVEMARWTAAGAVVSVIYSADDVLRLVSSSSIP